MEECVTALALRMTLLRDGLKNFQVTGQLIGQSLISQSVMMNCLRLRKNCARGAWQYGPRIKKIDLLHLKQELRKRRLKISLKYQIISESDNKLTAERLAEFYSKSTPDKKSNNAPTSSIRLALSDEDENSAPESSIRSAFSYGYRSARSQTGHNQNNRSCAAMKQELRKQRLESFTNNLHSGPI